VFKKAEMKRNLLCVLVFVLACISDSESRKGIKNKIGGRSTVVPVGEYCVEKWQVCPAGTSCSMVSCFYCLNSTL